MEEDYVKKYGLLESYLGGIKNIRNLKQLKEKNRNMAEGMSDDVWVPPLQVSSVENPRSVTVFRIAPDGRDIYSHGESCNRRKGARTVIKLQ